MSARSQHSIIPSNRSPQVTLAWLAASASCLCSVASAQEEPGRSVRTLEEVIVTAQKRAERLEDVPISISVLSGADLDTSRADGITEALNRVPGVAGTVNFQSGNTQLTVRGVTAAGATFFGSNPIGYYLDTVPFTLVKSAIVPDSNAYDLQRVEVLRGPQGTLYGASALNGVVRVLTRDANLDRFEFKGRSSASSTADGGENFRGDVAINVPIVDGKFAARAVIGYQDLSGWIDKPGDKDANSQKIANYRLKLNARPTDELSIGLMAWRSRNDTDAPATSADGEFSTAVLPEPYSTDFDAYGLKIGYDFPAFSISSSTSYLDYENPAHVDFPAAPDFHIDAATEFAATVFSQEVNLSSTGTGVWQWTLGGFYRDGKDQYPQTLSFNGAPLSPTYGWHDQSESSAIFGQLTRSFADGRYELTGGLRYFEDTVTSSEGPVGAPAVLNTRKKFDATTPRVALTWHPSKEASVYASYAEGFRSGFDQFNFFKETFDAAPIKPDTLKNYEIGLKGRSADRRFDYEAAVFYIDWKDVQQALTTVTPDGVPHAGNTNGGGASGVGFELAASIRPVERLELGINGSWNDLTADDPVNARVFSVPLNDFQDVTLFEPGERLSNSPEYTVGVFGDYGFPLGGRGLEGHFSVSGNYTSEQEYRSLLPNLYKTVGDSMLICRAAFALQAGERWTATFYAENLNDERGTPIRGPVGVPDFSARVRPRTLGLQVEYHFD
jgi:iron complex outermembrane recepter protein